MTTAPNGELRRQDLHLQVQQLVSLRSLRWHPADHHPTAYCILLTLLHVRAIGAPATILYGVVPTAGEGYRHDQPCQSHNLAHGSASFPLGAQV